MQSYDNIFISHIYLQASKIIRKCLNLVDMTQHVITFLRLARDKLNANEEIVEQSPCPMNVAKRFPFL